MASDVQQICEAIVSYLNGQPFQLDFIAERANIAMLRQEEINRVRAYVAPQSITPTDSTRSTWDLTYQIAIVVVMPLTTTLIDAEDDLIEVVEAIQKSLFGQDMANAAYITNESTQAYFEETEWRDAALFVGTVVVNYLNKASIS